MASLRNEYQEKLIIFSGKVMELIDPSKIREILSAFPDFKKVSNLLDSVDKCGGRGFLFIFLLFRFQYSGCGIFISKFCVNSLRYKTCKVFCDETLSYKLLSSSFSL